MIKFNTFEADPESYKAWQESMTVERYHDMIGDFYKKQREILRSEIETFFTPARTRNIRGEIVVLAKMTHFDLIDIYTLQLNLFYLFPLYRELIFGEDLGLDHTAIKDDVMDNHCIPEWNKANEKLQQKANDISLIKPSPKELNFLEKYTNTKTVEKFWFSVVFPKIEELTKPEQSIQTIENKSTFSALLTSREFSAIRDATMQKNLIIQNDYVQASLITNRDSLIFRIDDELLENKDLQRFYKYTKRSKKKDFFSLKFLKESITPSTRVLWDFIGEKVIGSDHKAETISIHISIEDYMEKMNITDSRYAKYQLTKDLHSLSCGTATFYSEYDNMIVSSQVLKYFVNYKNERNNLEYKGKIGSDAEIQSIEIVFSGWIRIIQRLKQKQYIHVSEKHYQLNTQRYPHSTDLSSALHRLYRINNKKLSTSDSWHSIKLDTLIDYIDVTKEDIGKRGKTYYKNKIRDTLSYLEDEQIFEIRHIDQETIEYRPVNYEQALIEKPKKSSHRK